MNGENTASVVVLSIDVFLARAAAASPARRPNTAPSVSDVDPSRFAPNTPPIAWPAAKRPGRPLLVDPSPSPPTAAP